ncbi:hypothetical protein B0H13DRAFT_2311627 [Mycena leptocephala]|nr:hypothetical protein B0H13DRAFT_2311627 [Mycena leptocephala]
MHGAVDTFRWVVSCLAFVQKKKDPLGTLHALRCLADLYTIFADEATALNLFQAALAGGTAMDVHRLRAECMVGIGEIMLRRGDPTQAREMWTAAHPLFLRSPRMKDAAAVEKRLGQLSNTHSHSLLVTEDIADIAAVESSSERLDTLVAPNTSPSLQVESREDPGMSIGAPKTFAAL